MRRVHVLVVCVVGSWRSVDIDSVATFREYMLSPSSGSKLVGRFNFSVVT
jgi:hypothetical protein